MKIFETEEDAIEYTLQEGFWDEINKTHLIKIIKSSYTKETIKEWNVSDVIISGEKVLIKHHKRDKPLTSEEIEKERDMWG
jgi:hypothetical protein